MKFFTTPIVTLRAFGSGADTTDHNNLGLFDQGSDQNLPHVKQRARQFGTDKKYKDEINHFLFQISTLCNEGVPYF